MADHAPEWAIYIPLVSSLAGAFAGAWTAQYIAARNKRNDERLKEIRATNSAVTMAYGITDHFLSMKEQIIKPVVDDFNASREKFIEADAKPKPLGVTVITFKVPLSAFRFNWSPHKELQEIVFKELSAPIRPSMMVTILSRSVAMLDKLAEDRNALVKEIHDGQQAGKDINPYSYYGLPFPSGGGDARYANTLQHIADYTDDAIAFSKMLGDDLRTYALALRQTLPKSLQPRAPRITTMSFPKKELIPDMAKYKSYESLDMPIRVVGAGIWTPEFETMALAQYQDKQERWLS